MFTGIVETTAKVIALQQEGGNLHITLNTPIAAELSIDQSVAHDGICLTVVACREHTYTVTAIAETLSKTTIAHWAIGHEVNIERALVAGNRLDGHLVQGHIDGTITLTTLEEKEGSHVLTFSFHESFAPLIIEKGSVCINGISLTCFEVGRNSFSVAIIPYTWQHTTLHHIKVGDHANVEFDMMGKYLLRQRQLSQNPD